MRTFASFVAASGLAMALAAPLEPRQSVPTTVSLIALSSNSALQGQPINATGNQFFVGLASGIYCPVPAPDCAGFSNTTTIEVGGGGASMYDDVPGGQDVYVAQNGQLSFTTAHEEGIFPEGAYTGPFSIEPTGFGGYQLIFTGDNSSGFFACPTGENGAWEILAKVSSGGAICAAAADVELAAIAVSEPGAFEYD
ncbi:hypothetical protein MMC10_006353 [Thelotrema lepadinum]|nr:hypothetical protein [Thelotrema lepadinum]